MSGPTSLWEQRWHPLRRQWVIVAAHRQERPWLGERVAGSGGQPIGRHDEDCTFCPRNVRESGASNPDYRGIYVFDNDRPCVGASAPEPAEVAPGFYHNERAAGVARVICFSERHDLTLARMGPAELDAVLACWQQQYRELGSRPEVQSVLLFENQGEVTGVSNPHPHGQVYAVNFVFDAIAQQLESSRRHLTERGTKLWEDIVTTEVADGRRLLAEGPQALAFVPYFARYAFEAFVGPRRAAPSLADLDDDERRDLADVLHQTLVRLDNLWRMRLPYVMVAHNAPCDGGDHEAFGCHIEIYPPLRTPGLRKHLAGPELGGGNFLADTSPEESARLLREVPVVHYESNP